MAKNNVKNAEDNSPKGNIRNYIEFKRFMILETNENKACTKTQIGEEIDAKVNNHAVQKGVGLSSDTINNYIKNMRHEGYQIEHIKGKDGSLGQKTAIYCVQNSYIEPVLNNNMEMSDLIKVCAALLNDGLISDNLFREVVKHFFSILNNEQRVQLEKAFNLREEQKSKLEQLIEKIQNVFGRYRHKYENRRVDIIEEDNVDGKLTRMQELLCESEQEDRAISFNYLVKDKSKIGKYVSEPRTFCIYYIYPAYGKIYILGCDPEDEQMTRTYLLDKIEDGSMKLSDISRVRQNDFISENKCFVIARLLKYLSEKQINMIITLQEEFYETEKRKLKDKHYSIIEEKVFMLGFIPYREITIKVVINEDFIDFIKNELKWQKIKVNNSEFSIRDKERTIEMLRYRDF